MEERINELTERIPNDVDVTECKNMAEGIKETGMMILENANSCVTQKIDRANMLIENIKALANNSTKACDDVIKKSIECTNNSNVPLKIIECMGPVNDLLSSLTFVRDNRYLTMEYNDINTIIFRSRPCSAPS